MLTWSDVLKLPRSRFFWAERMNGTYACGNPDSLYLRGSDPEQASYDTGNNRVITISGLTGELKQLAIFKESYYSDSIPGVWVNKGRILAGPFHFGLKESGKRINLPDDCADLRTDLLECVVPMTTYALSGLEARVVAFAPISSDGATRPRGAFYMLSLRNTSESIRQGEIILPAFGHFSEALNGGDNTQIDRLLVPEMTRPKGVAFTLAPGEEREVCVWLGVYGEKPAPWLQLGGLYWLSETLAYYRKLCGRLTTPDNPFLQEFFIRTLCQCQQCVGMDADGRLAGSSWGTNPVTYEIWMKDMYYSMLPLAETDGELFRRGIEWFAEYGVRPEGVQFPGGVGHSLSNSLSAVIMAGIYFRATGDASFFRNHPEIVRRLETVVNEMIESRKEGEPWLYKSTWISDGLCMGDYHTGSNICAWTALSSFALILRDALGQCEKADALTAIAKNVRREILSTCRLAGPYGDQLCEGIGMGSEELQRQMKAESIEEFRKKNAGFGIQFYEFYNRSESTPYLVHDGEETDTTLAPYYGITACDDPLLRNYTRFAMTDQNRFYSPVSKGIIWEDCTDSTFPGYITGLSNGVDRESFDRYFGPIASLADLDGSIWWWPYPRGAKDDSFIERRPGKCGWASGAMIALLKSDLMGIRYDGVRRRLEFRPLNAIGAYTWDSVPLGSARVDLSFAQGSVGITNRSCFAIDVDVQLFGAGATVNGKEAPFEKGSCFGKPTVCVKATLQPGEHVDIAADRAT